MNEFEKWMHDDITWCGYSECEHKDCFRNLADKQSKSDWFSMAELKNTDLCPYKDSAQDVV